jgi:hypothetical protein
MNPDITTYNATQAPADYAICDLLALEICKHLPEADNKPCGWVQQAEGRGAAAVLEWADV